MSDNILKLLIGLIVLFFGGFLGGCAQVASGLLCCIDRQISACEWAGEDEAQPKDAGESDGG